MLYYLNLLSLAAFFTLLLAKTTLGAPPKVPAAVPSTVPSSAATAAPTTHRELMNQALNSFLELMPYSSSVEKYLDPKNSAHILKQLKELDAIFKQANAKEIHQSELFQSTGVALEDNIKVAMESFTGQSKQFSYLRMRETLHLCFHCHTQLPKEYVSSFYQGVAQKKRDQFNSDLDYAQYLFLIRNFEEAVTYHQKAVATWIGKKKKLPIKESFALESSLKQILMIMVKVWKDPVKAYDYFNVLGPKLVSCAPADMVSQVTAWVEQLKDWKDKKIAPPKELNEHREFLAYVNQTLTPLLLTKSQQRGQADILLLLSSGLLANYLFLHYQDPDRALVLYYLGLAEKELNSASFYALAENYFRECVVRYPQHPIAASCYQEFEDSMKFGYTGSRGEDLPPQVREELRILKEKLHPIKPTKTP